MGLAASQARTLLLTAKNDALELAAQKIENERLMLAQEQEQIATEYSEKTTNTIMTCRTDNGKGVTQNETMTLGTLAKSEPGKAFVIADANGKPLAAARAEIDSTTGEFKMHYYDANGAEIGEKGNGMVQSLNNSGFNTRLQNGLANGSFQLYVANTEETGDGTQKLFENELDNLTNTGGTKPAGYTRKATESLSAVTSRYYTEDDAAAQAEYNTQMARVNALDQRLENKLNQVETQKKAVEQEMESSEQLIQSNVERTFQYFS